MEVKVLVNENFSMTDWSIQKHLLYLQNQFIPYYEVQIKDKCKSFLTMPYNQLCWPKFCENGTEGQNTWLNGIIYFRNTRQKHDDFRL